MVRYFRRGADERKILVQERIKIFSENIFDPRLETHKLHGRMSDKWAFCINRKDRIVFSFISPGHVLFLDVGDHDVYK